MVSLLHFTLVYSPNLPCKLKISQTKAFMIFLSECHILWSKSKFKFGKLGFHKIHKELSCLQYLIYNLHTACKICIKDLCATFFSQIYAMSFKDLVLSNMQCLLRILLCCRNSITPTISVLRLSAISKGKTFLSHFPMNPLDQIYKFVNCWMIEKVSLIFWN